MELLSIIVITLFILAFIGIPGFMLSLALFPKKEDLDSIERAGLSTVLGLTPVFLLYFLDKNFSMPIDSYTSSAMFFLISLVGYMGWKYKKRK